MPFGRALSCFCGTQSRDVESSREEQSAFLLPRGTGKRNRTCARDAIKLIKISSGAYTESKSSTVKQVANE